MVVEPGPLKEPPHIERHGHEANGQNAHMAVFDRHVTRPVDVMTLKAIIAFAPTSAVG
ncbi:MAG: hypothetical protein U0790_28355 [Isosphaeraceae bacterium]